MTKWLQGKKTYFAAAFSIVAGLGGAYLGVISNDAAVELVVGGLALLGIRSAIANFAVGRIVASTHDAGAKNAELQKLADGWKSPAQIEAEVHGAQPGPEAQPK